LSCAVDMKAGVKLRFCSDQTSWLRAPTDWHGARFHKPPKLGAEAAGQRGATFTARRRQLRRSIVGCLGRDTGAVGEGGRCDHDAGGIRSRS